MKSFKYIEMQLPIELTENIFRSLSKWHETARFPESMPTEVKREMQTVNFQMWGEQAMTENTQESSLEEKERVLSKANNQQEKIGKLTHKCKRQKECIRQLTELIDMQSQTIKQLTITQTITTQSFKDSSADSFFRIELEKAKLKIKQLEAHTAQPRTNRLENVEKQNIRGASAEKISLLTKIDRLQWAVKKYKDEEELLRERNKELTEGNERLRKRLQDVKALNLTTQQAAPSYLNCKVPPRPQSIKKHFSDGQNQSDNPIERIKFMNEIKQLKKQISDLTEKVTSQTAKINELEASLREENRRFKECLNSRKEDTLQYSQCLNENWQLKQQLSGVLQRNETRRKQKSIWGLQAQQSKQVQQLNHFLASFESMHTEPRIN